MCDLFDLDPVTLFDPNFNQAGTTHFTHIDASTTQIDALTSQIDALTTQFDAETAQIGSIDKANWRTDPITFNPMNFNLMTLTLEIKLFSYKI